VLIRLFRGVIREGAHDRLLRGLQDHVLPRLEADPGVLTTTLAFGLEASPDEYLVETHWSGVRELARFAGDGWRTPRVEPGEEELLVSVSAHHYVTDGIERTASNALPERPFVCLNDVEIDGARLQVAWNGSAVHLPPREMAAMLALASDPGGPVSSAELARRIWPGSVMVTPHDVRRIIYQLRVVLREGGAPLRIGNLHGLGYGLELTDREPDR
jgi:Transcriptional regulatory protein, C terminal